MIPVYVTNYFLIGYFIALMICWRDHKNPAYEPYFILFDTVLWPIVLMFELACIVINLINEGLE